MYSIITTEGFVIDSRPSGEAGKLLFVFTKDFGLVMATAQGIRLEKSKLRYFVQEYSFGIFSFVKGKEYWRLTNAQESISSIEYIGKKERDILFARIALLLKKLLHGEEANPELYDVIYSLNNWTDFSNKNIESLVVLRIFHKLGYIGSIGELNLLLANNDITDQVLDIVEKNKVFINQHINKAIRESHL